MRQAALDENPDTCVYSHMETDSPQVDHAIPRAQGGNATIDNAQTTCGWCNASKGARDFPVDPPPGLQRSMAASAVGYLRTMTAPKEFVAHQEPVWREQSNFIINAELPEKDRPHRFEQLFARQLGEDRFEICCIPFSVHNIALADVVVTSPSGDHKYVVKGVVKPSGRHVFRVWFGESFQPREEIAQELRGLGSLIEWSSSNLLAVDAVDEEHAQLVADFLAERERLGQLLYETGRY